MSEQRTIEQIYREAQDLLRAHGIVIDAPPAAANPSDKPTPVLVPDKPTPAPGAPGKPTPVLVVADPGSRLEWLLDRYDELKPQQDKLKEQLDEVTAGVKRELAERTGHAHKVQLRRTPETPGLVLTHSTPGSFNSKGFRAASTANNALYLQWCTYSDRWDLRRET